MGMARCHSHRNLHLAHVQSLYSAPGDFLQLAPLKMSCEGNTSPGRVPVLLSSFPATEVTNSLVVMCSASWNSHFAALWGQDSSLGGSLCCIRSCRHREVCAIKTLVQTQCCNGRLLGLSLSSRNSRHFLMFPSTLESNSLDFAN